MTRARVQTAALMLSAILMGALLMMPLALARAGNRPSSVSAGNQLLRQFPLVTRRLCCTTRAGSGAASSTSSGSSSAPRQNVRTGAGDSGSDSWLVELLVVIAVLVVGLGVMAVLPRISPRTRSGRWRGATDWSRAPAVDPARADEVGSVRWMSNPVGSRDVLPKQTGREQTTAGNGAGVPADAVAPHPIDPPPLPYRATPRGRAEVVFNLGLLFYDAGELARAEVTWRRCLAHRDARAATNLGFLLERCGDPHGARLAYTAAERWGDPEGQRLGAALAKRV